MKHLRHTRSTAVPILALAEHVPFDPDTQSLLAADLTAGNFFELLIERQLLGDAVLLLPHLLPRRAAVWWGCLCAWDMARPDPPSVISAALQAAIRWVIEPSESNRRAAEGPALAASQRTAAGCLAQAAVWSSGSMLPPELPPVLPPPHLTAHLVGGAVLLAAMQHEPMKYEQHYRRFLAAGLEVARGQNLWTPTGTLAEFRPQTGPDEKPAAVAAVANGNGHAVPAQTRTLAEVAQ